MGDGWIVDFKKRIGRLSKPDLYVRVQKSNQEKIYITLLGLEMCLILVLSLHMNAD